VKRLLPYVILAFAFHAIILSTDFSWLELGPRPVPAAKSLSVSLRADIQHQRKAQAAVPEKALEQQPVPPMNQKPMKNPETMPAPARVAQSAQLQKPLPAIPPKKIVKKARLKKSLKALTYKKKQIKAIQAPRVVSAPKPHIPPKAETRILSTASSGPEPVRQPLPADTTFISKTRRMPAGSPAPATIAAMPPSTQSDNALSASAVRLARPLYKQNTSPAYPRKARRLGYEGTVMLKVLINENGRVDDLTVLKSSGHPVLDRAALSAVRKWLFEPGTEGGIKKKMWVKIPIRFDLK
jgi:protein TonB